MNKKNKDVPLDMIERWLRDSEWKVRAAAMNACAGKDVPLDMIERGLRDSDCDVRAAARNACAGKDVPLDLIERGLRDSDCDVRAAAMNACAGKDVPLDLIERWLRDSEWNVRAAAMNACKKNGIELPVLRTIEPAETVYKKCLCGVIVAATIPKDAQVRGEFGRKCRTNKATIVAVYGDICGENVGISKYDLKTTYYAGDEVLIEDFDYSNVECSAGFHFFNTRAEAEAYDL